MEKLIKKYERSKLSKSGSDRNINVSILFDEKNMPDYVSDRSYLYELEIEEAVEVLKKQDFIKVEYSFDHRIKKVLLNLENVEEVYIYLGRKSLHESKEEMKNILNKYRGKGYIVDSFIKYVEGRLREYKSMDKYFKSERELEEILFILERIEKQKEEVSLRSFSARYLGDSKRLEKIEGKMESIIRMCVNIEEVCEDSGSLLAKFNIYKNPSFVYIKGVGKFKINKQIIDLEALHSEWIVSGKQIDVLQIMELDCKEIVTIENLTSFYDYSKDDSCIIYLGGFHNEVRRKLLCKMYAFNKQLSFYHSGDIDAGGFYILNHLMEDTKIPFQARKMDYKVLMEYRNETIPLTIEDKKRIESLKKIENLKSYKETFDYMLGNNVKLEQENIKY